MEYKITHSLEYQYEQAVELLHHDVCLQPRTDAFQRLERFDLVIEPTPIGTTLCLDPMGNLVTRCWWPQFNKTDRLSIVANSISQTHCSNPFNYLLEPWALSFPIDYPRSQFESLSPYLNNAGFDLNSSTIQEWAMDLAFQCDFNSVQFLSALNQFIYQEFSYQSREVGEPFPPHVTWRERQGSCRDFVVLFMAACHGVGLASRFVSGYEEGSPDHEQTLHAWAEVYLPGAGWRGYDPTLGLVVCDRHISLAAHWFPKMTTPVNGGHRGQSPSSLNSKVKIEVI